MNYLDLNINFQSYWHAGTGRGSGHHLDALVIVDRHGLPYFPGKTIRGLLRDVFFRLETWGSCPEWVGKGTTELFFGSGAFEGDGENAVPREQTTAGIIHVSNATLPEDVAAWLAGDDGAQYRSLLFREHFSTVINEHGIAKQKSLHGMQITVPLQLKAQVGMLDETRAPEKWKQTIAAALPMLRCAGAHRSRGFGRCSITIEETSDA